MNPSSFVRPDTYNKKKTKYWVEKKVSASMLQSQLVRTSDEVSYQQDVNVDNGEVTLGSDVGFDLSRFDGMDGGTGNLSAGIPLGMQGFRNRYNCYSSGSALMPSAGEAELGLPNLGAGEAPETLAMIYVRGLQTRSTKLGEVVQKLQQIPGSNRSDNVKKSEPYAVEATSPRSVL